MEITGIDLQMQEGLLVCSIRHEDGKHIALVQEGEEGFVQWLWDTIKTHGKKGSFDKDGGWR